MYVDSTKVDFIEVESRIVVSRGLERIKERVRCGQADQ
jgi:hypothetical protein